MVQRPLNFALPLTTEILQLLAVLSTIEGPGLTAGLATTLTTGAGAGFGAGGAAVVEVATATAVPIGDPALPGTVVGPVIDSDAQEKILGLIEQGKREAKLAWQATLPPAVVASGGHFVPPTIFTHVKPDATIAREEIFGPVLAIIKVRDLDEAIAVANATDYALTGGLFSRSPRALERAERELMVGNLYLNRGITGAIVERHPFGGYKMSGGGTKAGGRGYLENFLFPRAIAENVLRRGFTPAEAGE